MLLGRFLVRQEPNIILGLDVCLTEDPGKGLFDVANEKTFRLSPVMIFVPAVGHRSQ